MKQEKYDKLKASFEASLPQLPPDFTERVMGQIGQPDADAPGTGAEGSGILRLLSRSPWRWLSIAACLLIIIGIGVTMWPTDEAEEPMLSELSSEAPENPGVRDNPEKLEILEKPETPVQPLVSSAIERKPLHGSSTSSKRLKKKHLASLPDTLGSGIWQSRENVQRAVQILADCEATIRREEQEVRNDIIEATFRATPQPANAILVSNEAGDYEVIEKRNIIEI